MAVMTLSLVKMTQLNSSFISSTVAKEHVLQMLYLNQKLSLIHLSENE
jgi:hypothetical protein